MNASSHAVGEPSRSRPSRARRIGVVALLGGFVYVVVGVVCFVVPHQDPLPRHADVAMVLGPPFEQRQALALDLLRRGVVHQVQLSVGPDAANPYSPGHAAVQRCRAMPRTVHCAVPVPFTTQGEARMLRSRAAAEGWRSAVVITQTAHLLRARTIVGRCFSGTIAMRASSESPQYGWPYQFAYQTAATVKAWFVTPTC